jgi:site-specific DNA recombinase
MERIVATDSETLVSAYENQIKKLERDKLILREPMNSHVTTADSFRLTYRTAMEFLANPLNLPETGQLADRCSLFRMAFAGRLACRRNCGYQTVEATLPFKALAMISPGKPEMVEPIGIEPTTS